ncbi:uncharacterized protein LOC130201593 isoform X2 [Pseudoliparis swirei]|uniref:uncharacterized protein LOC130201593 isoform X2 n=1 Tax=Pseudoliparis swirei TaxID=2059687 RepID=UPI0024BDBC8D|nr:uncharacterized protein LOC130201593 isoform X2 [Pseudoliparis swirei]
MLLIFSLLLYLCESSDPPPHPSSSPETLSLQLEAIPDYPVAEGQRVNLHCKASTMPGSAQWSWQRLRNHTWHEMKTGGDLTLTEPEQSGLYRCRAERQFSQNHAVYITSMQTTVSEYFGIAAFVLSLLALIIISAHLFWLSYQRLDATLTTPNIAAQGFPGPEKSPKGGLPHTECGGDVYMNYTNTSQAYTDLDPTNMTREDLYSSLS